jgi:hypothetical protein
MARRKTRAEGPAAEHPGLIEKGSAWPVSTGPTPFGNPPIETVTELDPDVDAATGQPIPEPPVQPDGSKTEA